MVVHSLTSINPKDGIAVRCGATGKGLSHTAWGSEVTCVRCGTWSREYVRVGDEACRLIQTLHRQGHTPIDLAEAAGLELETVLQILEERETQ